MTGKTIRRLSALALAIAAAVALVAASATPGIHYRA